jgi:ribonuclease PH
MIIFNFFAVLVTMLSNCVQLFKRDCEVKKMDTCGVCVSPKDMHPQQLRDQFVLTISSSGSASGSAYVELGDTKLQCTVRGPFPTMRGGFSDSCQVDCDLKYALFDKINSSSAGITQLRDENHLSSVLESAIKPMVCVDRYPKTTISINVLVLQSGSSDSSSFSSELSASIMACSAALAAAGIQMFNLLSSVTIACVAEDAAKSDAYEYVVHPVLSQLKGKTLVGSVTLAVAGTASGATGNHGGDVVYDVSKRPCSFETSQVYSQGRLPAAQLLEMLQLGGVLCSHVYHPVQKECVIRHALDTMQSVAMDE